MAERERIVAVGLLTERDLSILGQSFKRAYRIDEGHDFRDLLAAIDRADRAWAVAGDGKNPEIEVVKPQLGGRSPA